MFAQQVLYALKDIPHVKYGKDLLIMPVSLFFFTTLYLIWPKFCPKTTPTLNFFAGLQWKILGDSININNFDWNLNPFFPQTCAKMGSPWTMSKTNFLQKWQNQILSFQKLVIFIKIHMFWLSYECFSILLDAFLLKSVISCHNSCDPSA